MKRLKKYLLLSEKGYQDLKKAIIACTITNLTMLLPVMIAVGIFVEILNPLNGKPLNQTKLWLMFVMGIVFAVIVFLAAKNDYKKTYLVSYLEAKNIRVRLAKQLEKLPMSFFNTKNLSELTTNMMADCRSMESMLSSTLPPLIANVVSMTITCIGMSFFDWRMALAVFSTLPVSFLVILLSRKKQRSLFEKQVATNLEASNQVQEYLEGIKVIKANNLAGQQFQALNQALLAMKKIAIKVELIVGMFISSANIILQAGLGISIFIGVSLLSEGKIEFINLLMFLMISTRIYGPIIALMGQLSTLLHLETVTKRMRTVLTAVPMAGKKATVDNFNINIDHISFAYQKNLVIDDVSMQIPQGSVIAFVGPSGSGKSTLVKLISRFFDVDKGMITIGNKNIKEIQPDSLMQYMSFVFQDVILFNDTIYNNIHIGNMKASKEEVIAAAKAAMIHEYIEQLPGGYDTVLGENGATLSGGQRQRLSIARAILKDAPIILLDEATASLDPENEVLIQKAISKLVRGKTVIMIAHRLKTITEADQIFVLNNGKIVEQGTHKQLLMQQGLYHKLFYLQKDSANWAI